MNSSVVFLEAITLVFLGGGFVPKKEINRLCLFQKFQFWASPLEKKYRDVFWDRVSILGQIHSNGYKNV